MHSPACLQRATDSCSIETRRSPDVVATAMSAAFEVMVSSSLSCAQAAAAEMSTSRYFVDLMLLRNAIIDVVRVL